MSIHLVASAAGGDTSAWARLHELHDPRLRRHIAYVSRDIDVDEVSQRTWQQAMVDIAALREPAAFGGWLRAIARNTVRAERRRQLRERVVAWGLDEPCEDVAIERVLDGGDVDRALAALSALPPAQRRLIEHRVLRDRTTAETAAALGVAASTVHSELSRARRALAAAYGRARLAVAPWSAWHWRRGRAVVGTPAVEVMVAAVLVVGVLAGGAPGPSDVPADRGGQVHRVTSVEVPRTAEAPAATAQDVAGGGGVPRPHVEPPPVGGRPDAPGRFEEDVVLPGLVATGRYAPGDDVEGDRRSADVVLHDPTGGELKVGVWDLVDRDRPEAAPTVELAP